MKRSLVVLFLLFSLLSSRGQDYIDWFKSNDNCIKYGLLYNHYAARDSRIVPDGWHLPSRAEWETLCKYIDPTAVNFSNTAGSSLGEAGNEYWSSYYGGATNIYGFNARGSGVISNNGYFGNINVGLYAWCNDVNDSIGEANWILIQGRGLFNFTTDILFGYGSAIRLIKDDSTNPDSLVDYDGNVYETVKIGSQVWTAQNLITTHFNDGTIIPFHGTDNDTAFTNLEWAALTTPGVCAYNNDVSLVGCDFEWPTALSQENVFLIDSSRNVYNYNVGTKILSSILFNSVGYGDIANTDTKMWVANTAGTGSMEYDITLSPFSQTTSRDLTTPINGNAYCYMNDTLLIRGSGTTFAIYNMATDPPSYVDIKSMPSRTSVGDIVYNPYSDTYIVSNRTSEYVYYLTEFDSDFNILAEIEVPYTAIMGLFVYDGYLYAVNNVSSTESVIYKVVGSSLVAYDTISISVTGASQSPEANNVRIPVICTEGYGLLYNWYATQGTGDANITSSDDWVVPSNSSILALETYISDNSGKLKETGIVYWDNPNVGATNEYLFNGRGAGERSGSLGTYNSLKGSLLLWTSTEYANPAYAYYAGITSGTTLFDTGNPSAKDFGGSIRLLYIGAGTPTSYSGNDGKVYRIVTIGTQIWLADNLQETKFRDGAIVPFHGSDNDSTFTNAEWAALTTSGASAYDNDVSLVGCDFEWPVEPIVNYGYLYNWYAVNDIRGIAPIGFHVPSKAEWETLQSYAGGESLAGKKLKEIGTIHWNNDLGTDDYGFKLTGASLRDNGGIFSNTLKTTTCLWSSTVSELNANNVYQAQCVTLYDYFLVDIGGDKKYGRSLRFIADSGTPTTAIGNDGKVIPCVTIGTQTWTAVNSVETKYRNGDWIQGYDGGVYTPISNATWSAATTGMMCAYGDDESNAITP